MPFESTAGAAPRLYGGRAGSTTGPPVPRRGPRFRGEGAVGRGPSRAPRRAPGYPRARWVTAMHTRTAAAVNGAASGRCSPSSSTDHTRVSSG